MPTAGKTISDLDPIADPIPDDLDFPVAGAAGDNYRVQLPQILGRVPPLPPDVARTGQPNTFTAAQTVRAHAAVGNQAAPDTAPPWWQPYPNYSAVLNIIEKVTAPAAADSYNYEGIYSELRLSQAAGPQNASVFGFEPNTVIDSSNPLNYNWVYNVYGSLSHFGSGTLGGAYGQYSYVSNAGPGTITTSYGFYTYSSNDSSGKITTNYGLYVDYPYAGGGIITNYGLYVGDQTASGLANSWAVYSAGGTIQFLAGKPAARGLVVQGAPAQAANLTEWQNSSGTALAKVDANGLIYPPQAASPPAWSAALKGALFFNAATSKLMVAGASAWETVQSS